MRARITSIFVLSLLCLSGSVLAQDRTDGPEGSEFAGYREWDAAFTATLEFGASIVAKSDSDVAFTVGADFEYRPDEMFGAMFSYFGAFSPLRTHTLALTPLIATTVYNLNLAALAGPGVYLIDPKNAKLTTKFGIMGGVIGDVRFERFGIGLGVRYNGLFQADDFITVSGRLSITF